MSLPLCLRPRKRGDLRARLAFQCFAQRNFSASFWTPEPKPQGTPAVVGVCNYSVVSGGPQDSGGTPCFRGRAESPQCA